MLMEDILIDLIRRHATLTGMQVENRIGLAKSTPINVVLLVEKLFTHGL